MPSENAKNNKNGAASSAQSSARAVCYLNHSTTTDAPTHNSKEQRPQLNVPEDRSYATQRFMNPHDHPDDMALRGTLGFRDGMTEHQSRERMTVILGAYTQSLSSRR